MEYRPSEKQGHIFGVSYRNKIKNEAIRRFKCKNLLMPKTLDLFAKIISDKVHILNILFKFLRRNAQIWPTLSALNFLSTLSIYS